MKAWQRLSRPIETNHWWVVRDLPIIRVGEHLYKVANTFLQTQINVVYIHINKHTYKHTYSVMGYSLDYDNSDDDEPSIQFGRWAASDEKRREENAGESRARTKASPCMYAVMYAVMYACMELLICDTCNSVGVFAHLYMAGKASS